MYADDTAAGRAKDGDGVVTSGELPVIAMSCDGRDLGVLEKPANVEKEHFVVPPGRGPGERSGRDLAVAMCASRRVSTLRPADDATRNLIDRLTAQLAGVFRGRDPLEPGLKTR